MMLADPSKKYRRMYQRVDLPDRQWPNNEINQAPIWMSTDLRDGNQAIFEPMNMEQKLKMFHMLVKIGFKHIEIGFPSASQIDFDFICCINCKLLCAVCIYIQHFLTESRRV